MALNDGGMFSGRIGRVELGGVIADRESSLLGLSSRDRLFFEFQLAHANPPYRLGECKIAQTTAIATYEK